MAPVKQTINRFTFDFLIFFHREAMKCFATLLYNENDLKYIKMMQRHNEDQIKSSCRFAKGHCKES